jgi:hypothetical protein
VLVLVEAAVVWFAAQWGNPDADVNSQKWLHMDWIMGSCSWTDCEKEGVSGQTEKYYRLSCEQDGRHGDTIATDVVLLLGVGVA